ncbi:hypothetical protein M407DRAFT_17332 [Tulasnella calospora MUT 4182]|uniref:Fungal-type protein kinase domain-containing protein n=1 Tax=Tulasnella calospora MUT 4182 TaxID=1051891 RepID=A0A0C3QVP3_9AGAM|nr:hypothetical protein M407DRAFT_17332 [Tulasnella calospora MUT 4182]
MSRYPTRFSSSFQVSNEDFRKLCSTLSREESERVFTLCRNRAKLYANTYLRRQTDQSSRQLCSHAAAINGSIGSVDDRALRYTVAEYLSPITELSQPSHTPHVGWSVLQAIKFLRAAGWFHRDISVGYIGFHLVFGCQGVIVKLLDFDLSKEIGSSSKASHGTGTLPFMSIELLENPTAVHVDGKEEYGDGKEDSGDGDGEYDYPLIY